MSWRAAGLVDGGATPLDALVGGMRWAFGIGALISVGVLVLAFQLPDRAPTTVPGSEHVA